MISLLCTLSGCQNYLPPKRPKHSVDLEITITTPDSIYWKGEAIPLVITYANKTDKSITLWASGRTGTKFFSGEKMVVKNGDHWFEYKAHGTMPTPVRKKIKTGGTWKRVIPNIACGYWNSPFKANGQFTSKMQRRFHPFMASGTYSVYLDYSYDYWNMTNTEFFRVSSGSQEIQVILLPNMATVMKVLSVIGCLVVLITGWIIWHSKRQSGNWMFWKSRQPAY